MKKIFTLAAAAAMVFTASAVNPVRTQLPARCLSVSENSKQVRQEVVATHELLSRADDAVNIPLEGTYFYAVYYAIPSEDGKTAVGEAIESLGYYQIEKDPEVENGYIIKNFMDKFFNVSEDQTNTYDFFDLKATFDPETQILSIAGGQLIFHASEKNNNTGQFEEIDCHLVAGVENKMWSYDDPLEFKWSDGRMFMVSDAYMIGNLMTENGEQFLRGYPYMFFQCCSYIPNGSLDCYMTGLNQEKSFPILGVWKDGWFFVMNFTGCDPIHYAALKYDKNAGIIQGNAKWNPNGYCGWALTKIPAEYTGDQDIDIDYFLNPAFMDEQGYPTGKGYEIEGKVVKAENDEVIVEFPTYGLFDLNDILFAEIKDAVLTFKPNTIAGIEAVEAADNSNAPVVYYNLQGARVNNPANGIFIRQQGTQATKVLVK